jgi:hypothetical protein
VEIVIGSALDFGCFHAEVEDTAKMVFAGLGSHRKKCRFVSPVKNALFGVVGLAFLGYGSLNFVKVGAKAAFKLKINR